MTYSTLRITALAIVALVYLHSRFTQVQWESVVIFPSLGIQFETHRGIAGISLLAARKFIPWSSLEDFLINEGLRGWNVRYYLVSINRTTQGALQLEVAFEVRIIVLVIRYTVLTVANTQNILPRFPVLLEVYRSVQEALQNESEHRSDT
ncbi:hypothetical protein C8Q74DRAFT_1377717 [Fomes fomentarius]|nr:hypothetical protein C8Q74DRAFT_1377717 [Fomes fomentarius]